MLNDVSDFVLLSMRIIIYFYILKWLIWTAECKEMIYYDPHESWDLGYNIFRILYAHILSKFDYYTSIA